MTKTIHLILFVILGVLLAWCFHVHFPQILAYLNKQRFFTPILFLLLHGVVGILCFPVLLLVLAGGVLFGPIMGTVMNILGALIGATCGFCISRYFSTSKLGVFINKQKLMKRIDSHGWKSIAILRLIPIIPFHAVNYSLGLSSIRFTEFICASAIFLIPNKLLMTCAGHYGINVLKFL